MKTVLAIFALVSISQVAYGQTTLIEDQFSRTGVLAGSTPSPDNSSFAGTWSEKGSGTDANNSATTNGSAAVLTANQNSSNQPITEFAYLPFAANSTALAANSIYTLSATVNPENGYVSSPNNGGWAAIGFDTGGAAVNADSSGGIWMLQYTNGGVQAFGTGNAALTTGGSASTSPVLLKLTLNTSTDLVSYYENSTLVASTTLGSLPTLNDITISSQGGAGNNTDPLQATFSNITLTQSAVPEPRSVASLLLGALGFGLMFRRRLAAARA